MQDTTFAQATNLKTTIDYLSIIKADLANSDSQTIIILKKRPKPTAPPSALVNSLSVMESFLVEQAQTEIQFQIDTLQAQFDALQDS